MAKATHAQKAKKNIMGADEAFLAKCVIALQTFVS